LDLSQDLPDSVTACYLRIVRAEDTAPLGSNRSADADRLTADGSGFIAPPVFRFRLSRGRAKR